MLKIAVENIKNWIFVTGAIRSGTTFVGQILSLPLEVDYIHEPFNPMCGMPGIERSYRYVRPRLDTEQMQSYHEITKSIFNYDLTLKSWHPQNDPWPRKAIKRLTGSRGPFYLRLAKTNPFHKAAVIKDPTGSLLSEYLHLNFGVKPVIVIKHPASFIASLKRVNWWPHPGKMKDQPHLIEDYFSDEVDFLHKKWSDPILGSAAYWRALNKVFLIQTSKYPDWQVITHEELSQNPVSNFKKLYEALALPWSESVKSKIIKQTQNNSSAEARKGLVQDFQRNSRDIFEMRRDSLSLEERKAIFEVVEDVALQIYSKESFAI
ncbi:MAG: sulfotransferase [Xenococcaceae cyanobacterium MO_188.B32]|nr:sulfotransferase [Xenococcaceae cyanobacterium MO_188.B32]